MAVAREPGEDVSSFLLELRTTAAKCSNGPYRDALRVAAARVAEAFDTVAFTMSTEDMRTLVGAWTVAAVMLNGVPPEADANPPLAGAPEAARLAA